MSRRRALRLLAGGRSPGCSRGSGSNSNTGSAHQCGADLGADASARLYLISCDAGPRHGWATPMNISLRNVTKGFDRVTAVDRVTLEIADGELFTLLGPSGCGKTTLLRLIAGFGAPDAGEIWFGERRVDQLRPYERNIGMVFQNYALWPHMTARANITYGLRLRKLDGATIARLADSWPTSSAPTISCRACAVARRRAGWRSRRGSAWSVRARRPAWGRATHACSRCGPRTSRSAPGTRTRSTDASSSPRTSATPCATTSRWARVSC